MKKITKEDFIERSKNIHGDKYGYNNINYQNTKTKVKISCKTHGTFEQTPEKHMAGQGCPKCRKEKMAERFIARNKNSARNIDKYLLKELYLKQNLNIDEISKIINIPAGTISDYIRKHNLQKDPKVIAAKTAETNISRYGTKTPAQNPEVLEKMKQTNLERYGSEYTFSNEEIFNKCKDTMLKRYGVKFPIQNEKIKEKIENTVQSKYQTDHPMKNLEIQDKVKNLFKEKYGSHPMKLERFKEKIRKTNRQRYGVDHPILLETIKEKIRNTQIENGTILTIFDKTIREWSEEFQADDKFIYHLYHNHPNISKEFFIKSLENYQPYITTVESFIAGKLGVEKWDKKFHPNLKYKPDFKLTESLALNVDGLYWHSEKVKDKKYHFNMRKDYEQNNLRILQFREDEVFNKTDIVLSIINNALGQTSYKIGARKTQTKIVPTSEAKEFLNKNHIKGYKAAKHLGLYYNNELVSVMSYKRGNKDNLKIERFCSKIGYSVVGGFSKLIKKIENENPNLSIDYWVDLRYGTGNFLLTQNFKLEKETLGWEWTDGYQTYNRLRCRANMDERGLSEREHAEELKWYKIYDAGQRLYTKKPIQDNS